jgi:porphobilinogen synthase
MLHSLVRLGTASQNHWLDERTAILEALAGVKRVGADIIVTYHTPDIACWPSA